MSLLTDSQNKLAKSQSLAKYLTKVPTKCRKLVKLEIDFIPQSRMKWDEILADRTTDRDRAETAINACYQYAGLEQSRILWTENPLTAMTILINRPDLVDVGSRILHQIWESCNQEIERQIEPEFIDVVKAYANPRAQIIGEQQNIAFDPLGDFLNQVSICEIQKSYPLLDPLSLPAAMQDHRIAYLSYFDYFHQIGIEIPQIQLLVDLAKSCGCCWAFDNITILTPKPSATVFSDSGELLALVYDGVNILD
jgi:hypothetical protein